MEYAANIDELIAKQLTGEISAQELHALEQWLADSPQNRRYLELMQRIWHQSELARHSLPRNLDVEQALLRTKNKIETRQHQKPARIVSINSRWMGLAAAITLLIATVWFIWQNNAPEQTTLAANENLLRDTLSDGSVIALNRYSEINTRFDKQSRRVKMRGEAYFQVAHDPEKPFVIEVKQVEVTVVGTKFNIDGNSDSNKVKVIVEEGKVKVQIGDQTVYLTAGQQASVDCQTGQILCTAAPVSSNAIAWANRQFVFDDAPLGEVIPLLEEAYGVQIRLSNTELEKCRLHARFNNEPFERVITLISETFGFKITNRNGQYMLDGQSCGG